MSVKYLFMVLAGVFLVAGLIRWPSNRIQARIWVIIGIIFGVVSLWLMR